MNRRRPAAARGFTLLEVLIAVLIIGVIAALAFPSYQDYGRRANRTVAKALLTDAAAREEAWFSDRKSYTNSLGADGLNLLSANAVTNFYADINSKPTTAAGAIYNIAIMTYVAANTTNCGSTTPAPASTATSPLVAWTLVATPAGGQVRDTSCGKICLSQDGTRGASGPSGLDCWTR